MPAAFIHPFAKPTRESFIRIERGEGALVWDENGRELVDGMASLWYNAIGHGRGEMADAIAAQVRTLARVLDVRSLHQRAGGGTGRGVAPDRPDAQRPDLLHQLGIRSHRHRDEAGAHRPTCRPGSRSAS